MDKPELSSDIDFVPAVVNGRQVIAVNDPLHFAEGQVILETALAGMLRLFNGANDMRDIQVALMRSRGGQLVSLDEIRDITERLDSLYLLRSERFLSTLHKVKEEFAQQSDRPPCHAGKSYDPDARNLAAFIEEAEGQLVPLPPDCAAVDVAGIVAPHIDIQIARSTYVDLYRRLRGRRFDLVVLLGINHRGGSGLYSVSGKNYVTPLGTLPADRDAAAELAKRVPAGTLAEDDFDHRTEHSLEFQAVFLRHYLPQTFSILPILCNGIHEVLADRRDIFMDERFAGMAAALKAVMFNSGRRTLLVAGVDFAHIGMKFGHPLPADAMREEAERNDRQVISCLERGDPKGIYENALETHDRFNICGLPALLLFSQVLRDHPGRLIYHGYYDETATRSAVTYASMIYGDDSSSRPPLPEGMGRAKKKSARSRKER